MMKMSFKSNILSLIYKWNLWPIFEVVFYLVWFFVLFFAGGFQTSI